MRLQVTCNGKRENQKNKSLHLNNLKYAYELRGQDN